MIGIIQMPCSYLIITIKKYLTFRNFCLKKNLFLHLHLNFLSYILCRIFTTLSFVMFYTHAYTFQSWNTDLRFGTNSYQDVKFKMFNYVVRGKIIHYFIHNLHNFIRLEVYFIFTTHKIIV